jgi:hypothetical protein
MTGSNSVKASVTMVMQVKNYKLDQTLSHNQLSVISDQLSVISYQMNVGGVEA